MTATIINDVPTDSDWTLVEQFHGHLGPWIALGMRIGLKGIDALHPRPHFGLNVEVQCPLRTPFSCIVDGLQLSTGATYGKRNIVAIEADESSISVLLKNRDTAQSIKFLVDPGVNSLFSTWFEQGGGGDAAHSVWQAPVEQLWTSINLTKDEEQ